MNFIKIFQMLALFIIAKNSAKKIGQPKFSSQMAKLCSKNICSKCSDIMVFGVGGNNFSLRRTCHTILRLPRCYKHSSISML